MSLPANMTKFGFRIRTRSGLPVDNLVVHARDQVEAERKPLQSANRDEGNDLDNIISLISRQPDEK
jgi:hypothetical protein